MSPSALIHGGVLAAVTLLLVATWPADAAAEALSSHEKKPRKRTGVSIDRAVGRLQRTYAEVLPPAT